MLCRQETRIRAGSTFGMVIEATKTHTVLGEGVEMGCMNLPAIAPKIRPPRIIRHNQDDVGLPSGLPGSVRPRFGAPNRSRKEHHHERRERRERGFENRFHPMAYFEARGTARVRSPGSKSRAPLPTLSKSPSSSRAHSMRFIIDSTTFG